MFRSQLQAKQATSTLVDMRMETQDILSYYRLKVNIVKAQACVKLRGRYLTSSFTHHKRISLVI